MIDSYILSNDNLNNFLSRNSNKGINIESSVYIVGFNDIVAGLYIFTLKVIVSIALSIIGKVLVIILLLVSI